MIVKTNMRPLDGFRSEFLNVYTVNPLLLLVEKNIKTTKFIDLIKAVPAESIFE